MISFTNILIEYYHQDIIVDTPKLFHVIYSIDLQTEV